MHTCIPPRWALHALTHTTTAAQYDLENLAKRQERFRRTKIGILNFHPDGVKEEPQIRDIKALEDHFAKPVVDEDKTFTLYVVEDLSRDVIEMLGSKRMSGLGRSQVEPNSAIQSVADTEDCSEDRA